LTFEKRKTIKKRIKGKRMPMKLTKYFGDGGDSSQLQGMKTFAYNRGIL